MRMFAIMLIATIAMGSQPPRFGATLMDELKKAPPHMAHHIQQQPHHHDENEPPRRSHVADPRDERDDRVSGRGRRTRIVVSGQGVVKKKPTRAVVTTTIEARASTAKDARTQEAAHVSGVKG